MKLIVDLQKHLPYYDLDVSFSLAGEALGILGASGSGKSMTLRCIAGIETPTRGTIILNDRVLYDSRQGINLPSRDRKVGFVFQNYALFPHLTVAQNIAYGLKKLPKAIVKHQVTQHLDQFKLSGLGDRYPQQLSSGQQQRVALARALAPEPDLLLLDEPFSALDTHLRNELENHLIKTLVDYQGLTLLVSHNLEEAYRVCQKLLVLDQGQVAAAGDKQTIFDRPGTLAVAQLTGCKNYSRIQPIDRHTLRALDWACTLQTAAPLSPHHTHIGIHAHQITFLESLDQSPIQPNTLSAWVAWISETPHRITIYLKLGKPPIDTKDYQLQVEVFKEKWDQLKKRSMPWLTCLSRDRLMLLTS
ncbi:sulfate/molybdate ABC transporter ATP-binding protein [Trichothermofontia sp.]